MNEPKPRISDKGHVECGGWDCPMAEECTKYLRTFPGTCVPYFEKEIKRLKNSNHIFDLESARLANLTLRGELSRVIAERDAAIKRIDRIVSYCKAILDGRACGIGLTYEIVDGYGTDEYGD